MSNEKSKAETNAPEIEWNAENEIQLFYAMRGHKPVGVSKNFHMIAILESFVNSTSKDVSSKQIWDHLEELYDMDTLHENQDLPFPNHTEFTIEGNPEFEEMIANKIGNGTTKTDKDSESHEQNEVTTPVSKTGQKSSAHSKAQESNKTSTKVKANESEKSAKSERKEETVKHDKNDEIEDKSNRSKKLSKAASETRSASHSTPSSAKKRK